MIEQIAKQIYNDKRLDTKSKIENYLNKYYKHLTDSEKKFIQDFQTYGYVITDINLYSKSY